MTDLTFLGTGGGRFTTVSQLRQTGGMYLRDRGLAANIDPGPGALVHMVRYGLDPTQTDALLVTHAHPDHWTDAPVLIEGMTRGGLDRRGALLAPPSVLSGTGLSDGRTLGPVVPPFQQAMLEDVVPMTPGAAATLSGLYDVTATRQDHSDPDTVGFRIQTTHGWLSYIPDTQHFEELAEQHKGSRLVVCQMTRGGSDRVPWHMCTDDVEQIADEVRPRLLLLTHFGYKTLRQGDPGRWAQRITDRTGVATVAARDGLRVTMDAGFDMEMVDSGPLVAPQA